jgi:hypothetical protein
MSSRDRRHTTQRGPDGIVGLSRQLAKAWAALAQYGKASRTVEVEASCLCVLPKLIL